MKKFTCVQDIGNLHDAVAEALAIKKDRFAHVELGRNKTLMMIFFNSSLRTRLSTQKAAMNLGMNVIVLDVNQGAWKLETERGVIMDGDKAEHLLEAIPVMGSYCDIIGVRSFAGLTNKAEYFALFDVEAYVVNCFDYVSSAKGEILFQIFYTQECVVGKCLITHFLHLQGPSCV